MRQLILLLVISILLTSCTEQIVPPLRIGTNIWPGYEPFYVTRHKYTESMEHIKLIEYRNASQVLNGIINNSIDVAAVTLDEAVKIKALGFDIEVVWVVDYSNGADALLTKPEITNSQELIGKRIGAETSALGLYVLSRYLELNNLKLSDITLVNLEANRHVQAYLSNEIDAVFTFEPSVSKLTEAGAIKLFDSTQIPGEIVDVLIINKKTITAQKHALLHQFLSLNNQTVKHIIDNITPYISSLNQRLNLSDTQLVDTFSKLILLDETHVLEWMKDTKTQQRLIDSYNETLLSLGKIEKKCQCASLINMSYVERVINEG